MRSVPVISHEATVESVDKEFVTVLLSPSVSCSGCQAERACGMSGSSVRIIRVAGSFDLHPGERVEVSIRGSQGYMALFLGYLLPLFLVVATLIIFSISDAGEFISGLASFGILIPYYIILWIFRRFVGKKFSFNIKTAI
jgi:positive regulator of sigma E activity